MDAVERWFGPGFATLHPRLQQLHRGGGVLRGEAAMRRGRGLAGWLGARVARRLGFPSKGGVVAMCVDIRADADALHWSRSFGDGAHVVSVFRPVGAWPHGHWLETTGALRLALQVDTRDGAWRWRPVRAWWRGMRVPLALIPRVEAGKAIEGGDYVFDVGVHLPVLGLLFAYGGRLALKPR